MPNRKIWAYIARLERAIKHRIESSEEIADLIIKIQAEGVEVSLNCIAFFSDPTGRTLTGREKQALGGKLAKLGKELTEELKKLRELSEGRNPRRREAARGRSSPEDGEAQARGRTGGKGPEDRTRTGKTPPGRRLKRERPKPAAPNFEINDADREFLRSIGIRFD